MTGFPKRFPFQADAVVSGMQFDVDCTFKFHIQPTSAEAKALRGSLPSRRSLTQDWTTIVKGYTKLTDDDLNTTLSAAEHVQVRPSHAVINFIDQIYGLGIGPTLTKLMANQLSASDALAAMTPVVQSILANQKGV